MVDAYWHTARQEQRWASLSDELSTKHAAVGHSAIRFTFPCKYNTVSTRPEARPTENSDGTPLLDLAGYNVLWGTDPDDLAFSATIENAGITSYVVEGLTTGTYYFAVTAFNRNGLASDRCGEMFRSG